MNDSDLPLNYNNRSVRTHIREMDVHTGMLNSVALSSYLRYRKRVSGAKDDLLNNLKVVRCSELKMPVLVVARDRLMTPEEEASVLKTAFTHRQLNVFHVLNCKKMGLGNESYEVRLDSERGPLIAVVLRDALTDEEAIESKLLLKCHDNVCLGWSKGCEADTRPTSESIIPNLKNFKVMKSSGLTSSNVSMIVRVGPTKKDGSGQPSILYKNKIGDVIKRPFCSVLDRHKWNRKGVNSLEHNVKEMGGVENISIIERVTSIYKAYVPIYLSSRGFDRSEIEDCMSTIDSSVSVSTLKLTDRNSIGVHRDPPTPMPACAFGMTTYEYCEESKSWISRIKGGKLYLINGLIMLDYSPRDVVLFDGNKAHGVTKLVRKQTGGDNWRFSVLLFSRWRREKRMMKPGNYCGMGDSIAKRPRRIR